MPMVCDYTQRPLVFRTKAEFRMPVHTRWSYVEQTVRVIVDLVLAVTYLHVETKCNGFIPCNDKMLPILVSS